MKVYSSGQEDIDPADSLWSKPITPSCDTTQSSTKATNFSSIDWPSNRRKPGVRRAVAEQISKYQNTTINNIRSLSQKIKGSMDQKFNHQRTRIQKSRGFAARIQVIQAHPSLFSIYLGSETSEFRRYSRRNVEYLRAALTRAMIAQQMLSLHVEISRGLRSENATELSRK